MSEYLSKKAVLEYTKQNAAIFFDLESYHDFRNAVLSGAFDADDSEIQRLRAALHKITQIFDDPNLHDLTACQEMNRVAKEALSTTIEPTNATKVERFECPCCGCEINAKERVGTDEWRHKHFGAEWPKAEGDGNDA